MSRLATARYQLLIPYSDESDTTFASNALCPRYAENDPTSAPPSPASVASFDILDSTPWRRSYISLGDETDGSRLRMRWRAQRMRIIVFLLLFTVLGLGCGVGGYLAVKHGKSKT
jgi:hypothetical protein